MEAYDPTAFDWRGIRRDGTPDEEALGRLTDAIVRAVDPERIILFGSAERGEMNEGSDLDVLVIKDGQNRWDTSWDVYLKEDSRTPEEVRHWLNEAAKRLKVARKYTPQEDARRHCEQAAYVAEFSIKGVIVSRDGRFPKRTTSPLCWTKRMNWARWLRQKSNRPEPSAGTQEADGTSSTRA